MNTKLLSSIVISVAFASATVAFITGLGLVGFLIGVSGMVVSIVTFDYAAPHYCGAALAEATQRLPLAA